MPSEIRATAMRFYKAADEILKADSPCNIKTLPNGLVQCAKGVGRYQGISWCCSDCRYAKAGVGCTIQSIGCKLGWCFVPSYGPGGAYPSGIPDAVRNHPTYAKLNVLYDQARKELGSIAGFPRYPLPSEETRD